LAQGHVEETNMIPGWMWVFRRLTISLPIKAWSSAITLMINEKNMTKKELESTIGYLTHISMITPFVHHFLSWLCKLHLSSKWKNWRTMKIILICINGLELMNQCFLEHAREGISMNPIDNQQPTHVYRLVSCRAGIKGYSHTGFT
jgi:hypothetical protein